jgi:uncharacterized protein (TIGR02147 family)
MEKNKQNRVNITQYGDYRLFLKDLFASLKSQGHKISYQYCAKHLKTSKNYIKLIMDRKRHLSLDKVTKIAKLFKLSKFEKQVLFFLVLKGTVEDAEMVSYFDGVLGSLKSRQTLGHIDTMKESDPSSEVIYGDWLKLLLHSAVNLKGFKSDPEWMQQTLVEPFSSTELSSNFQDLLSRGLIVKKEDRYVQREFVFRRPSETDISAFQIFRLGLERSQRIVEQIEKFRPNQSYMMALAMTNKEYVEVRKKILELRDFMIEISKSNRECDQLFFTCNHIFAVSK